MLKYVLKMYLIKHQVIPGIEQMNICKIMCPWAMSKNENMCWFLHFSKYKSSLFKTIKTLPFFLPINSTFLHKRTYETAEIKFSLRLFVAF